MGKWTEKDEDVIALTFKNVQAYNGNAKAELIKSATKIVPGGYIVELAIKLDAIKLQAGMLIGFDFQVIMMRTAMASGIASPNGVTPLINRIWIRQGLGCCSLRSKLSVRLTAVFCKLSLQGRPT